MTVDDFCLRLAKDCGVACGDHVLAAVSGGADSVALLEFLCAAREPMGLAVSCAHVEHGIRGEDSLADMDFVRRLCEERGVPFYAARVDAPALAAQLHTGLEDAARRLRYAFLEETAERIGAVHIALAHHRQDQAETVLLHAARGCDVRGLCGMRARSGRLIRPLLGETREMLVQMLVKRGISWREDASNADPVYARNVVRMEAMPALERACPGASGALARLALAAQRDEDYFSSQIAALQLHIRPLACGTALERAEIEPLHDALLGRVIAMALERAGIARSVRAVDAVMRLLRSGGEAVSLEGPALARLGARYLCLTREERPCDTPLAPLGDTDTPFGRFSVRAALPGERGDGVRMQTVSAHVLAGALVTARREGDMLIPFGMHTPKRLGRLMIDEGIERGLRGSLPVIRRGEEILWAVGVRCAEACRAKDGEEQMMITFHGFLPAAAAERGAGTR